eukprot:403341444
MVQQQLLIYLVILSISANLFHATQKVFPDAQNFQNQQYFSAQLESNSLMNKTLKTQSFLESDNYQSELPQNQNGFSQESVLAPARKNNEQNQAQIYNNPIYQQISHRNLGATSCFKNLMPLVTSPVDVNFVIGDALGQDFLISSLDFDQNSNNLALSLYIAGQNVIIQYYTLTATGNTLKQSQLSTDKQNIITLIDGIYVYFINTDRQLIKVDASGGVLFLSSVDILENFKLFEFNDKGNKYNGLIIQNNLYLGLNELDGNIFTHINLTGITYEFNAMCMGQTEESIFFAAQIVDSNLNTNIFVISHFNTSQGQVTLQWEQEAWITTNSSKFSPWICS